MSRKPPAKKLPQPRLDRFACYELAVTNASRLAPFLAAVHGGRVRTLREDFSGTAATARAWARLGEGFDAIAVDLDRACLKRAAASFQQEVRTHPTGTGTFAVRIEDVTKCTDSADVISATNFPLGYFHQRRDLIAYLKHARRCLRSRGVFVADIYGGPDAFDVKTQRVAMKIAPGVELRYVWEQREANPRTGRVLNALHFELRSRGKQPVLIRNAFVYDWRLWSVPELTDAMLEAGFKDVDVYNRLFDAVDQDGNTYVRPLDADEPLSDDGGSYVVYVVGRK